MEDYFCIIKNVKSARLYIEYLGKKFKGEDIKISFAGEDYDLYESYAIVDFGKRFGVDIIPSIFFNSKEGIQIIVFNPKLASSASISNLLEKIKSEKANRIINILYSLTDKFSVHISPKQIVDKLDKPELMDIYLAMDTDILELIVELGYCSSVKEATSKFFNKVNLPRLLFSYDTLMKNLSNEKEIYLVNPDYCINTGCDLKSIKGFILNYKHINNKIKDICNQKCLDLRFGSGKFIE